MTIEVTVVAKSKSVLSKAITTLQLKYPRFIHGELMTHRVFSRNASSSRAIPIKRMISEVKKDPAKPIHWGTNKPGMQAGDELQGVRLILAKIVWSLACRSACFFSGLLYRIGLHKQHANRITEPFQHIHVVVTATEWDNFFELRNHKDAQPEIKALAQAMQMTKGMTGTNVLDIGEWHLPYITQKDLLDHPDDIESLLKISAARCARVSYLNHDGKPSSNSDDLRLYEMLAGSNPKHLSPLEHQATPTHMHNANFVGWRQFRSEAEKGVTKQRPTKKKK